MSSGLFITPNIFNVLLIGPNDPFKGDLSFTAPPLGVWRLCGYLRHHGISCNVFDPNLYIDPYTKLIEYLQNLKPAIIGFSITSMTLPYDLSLIHLTKKHYPEGICIGGGIGATFEYNTIFNNSPLDYCIMGEGEIPLLNICNSIISNNFIDQEIPGLIFKKSEEFIKNPNPPLTYEQFKIATFNIPYQEIPVEAYWNKMLAQHSNADIKNNEILRDIYSIRLMTANYCPMKCSFCSYTNFLNASNNGKTTNLVRLKSEDIIPIIKKIVNINPKIKTLIFQDDIFIVKNENRCYEIYEEIIKLKKENSIPDDLSFIASCRLDFLDNNHLSALKQSGFRLVGFGVESFSKNVLKEYLKENIYTKIDDTLEDTLKMGITPFIDVILVSPNSTFEDVSLTINKCFEYLEKGCEFSISPTVIPFAGARLSENPDIKDLISYKYVNIPKTDKGLWRGKSIQPREKKLRKFISIVEKNFEKNLIDIKTKYQIKHSPSRIR